jgi:hypothetical protein
VKALFDVRCVFSFVNCCYFQFYVEYNYGHG